MRGMSIPAGVSRISLVGHLGATEQFDTSFWVTGGTVDLAAAQTLADDIASFITSPGSFDITLGKIHSTDGYDELRVYAYPAGGPGATFIAAADLSLAGTGGGGFNSPFQTCEVLSLRTPFQGRSYRGRMYLPATNSNLTAAGLIATSVQDLADEWGTLFTAVNALTPPGGPVTVSVVSQTLTSTTAVTQVLVDNKPDIQRRRANGLSATVTASSAVS